MFYIGNRSWSEAEREGNLWRKNMCAWKENRISWQSAAFSNNVLLRASLTSLLVCSALKLYFKETSRSADKNKRFLKRTQEEGKKIPSYVNERSKQVNKNVWKMWEIKWKPEMFRDGGKTSRKIVLFNICLQEEKALMECYNVTSLVGENALTWQKQVQGS